MKLITKTFDELTTAELYEIYKLRISVFVVEQNCPYQEIDDADKAAIHLWLQDENGIQAYARALPLGATFPEASIGRVIAVQRHCGLGSQIVSAAIRTIQEKFHTQTIKIEAQTYVKALYEKLGFVQISEQFLEDGIPHVMMEYRREIIN